MKDAPPPPKNPFLRPLAVIGEFLFGGGVVGFIFKIGGVLSGAVTIASSPYASVTFGFLILLGGVLFGGSLIRSGIEQLRRPPSTLSSAPIATPAPPPPFTPQLTTISTAAPVTAAPSTPTPNAKPSPRPGVTANVILHRSVTEHLHTDDGRPGPAKPPSAAAKSSAPPQVTPTAPPPVVEVRPAGRVLTAEQRATLKSNLTSLNGHHIGVYSDWNDEESGKYGYQLFQSAGIDVGLMVGKEMRTAPPPPLSIEVYTDVPVNENTVEIQDALTLRGALVAARLMDPATKINVIPKATLTGGKNEVHLMLGPRAAVAQ